MLLCTWLAPAHHAPPSPCAHADLQILYLSWNPLGGSIPANWTLPDNLQSLLLQSCNLTGPLPEVWPRRLKNLNLMANQLTGGLEGLTNLDNVQLFNLVR